ncbi:Na+/H+ antiporter subunit E [Xanthobacter sp. KR7-225]|uniref:Na+/H+ antiporter subunit E n=1 Tax=Xanthobacter sp. KR7-225 TaxID=3156613 RepID=UPI0032B41214
MRRTSRAEFRAGGRGGQGAMGELFTAHGVTRWLAFLAGWGVLAGMDGPDVAAGLLVAALAARLSLALLPPAGAHLRPSGVAAYLARFSAGALRAGWDAARRVAARPPRVAPGILTLPCAVPQGLPRDAFRALASLQPGTLPLAAPGPDLVVHCLDVTAPVAAALAADADAFLAMGERRGHG